MEEPVQQSELELESFRALRFTFYGAGSMAEAFVRGMLERGLTSADRIGMLNRSNQERLSELHNRYGVRVANTTIEKEELLGIADIVVLAMKPKDAAGAIAELRPLLRPGTLIISVIAGLSLATMQHLLGQCPIVRTMPNTSSTIGLGATGVCTSVEVSDEQRQAALTMLRAVGIVIETDEPLIDTVTGLSGSGPAYVYYMMEAMIEAGVKGGLTPEQARELTMQTVRGAGEMVRVTGEQPSDLRRKVTSPNGTTQAALAVLDDYRFTEGIQSAVHRARERAQEMGEQIGRDIR
ncbi:pyrroline-5-carboxylate reductase [Paenibacillus sp. 481]|uniref:pyrroline-5-carboxylate reductase n=1 Tax=Paenibacillus sp. 481 TaxID=2835869 RepID=UPI003FA684C7